MKRPGSSTSWALRAALCATALASLSCGEPAGAELGEARPGGEADPCVRDGSAIDSLRVVQLARCEKDLPASARLIAMKSNSGGSLTSNGLDEVWTARFWDESTGTHHWFSVTDWRVELTSTTRNGTTTPSLRRRGRRGSGAAGGPCHRPALVYVGVVRLRSSFNPSVARRPQAAPADA